MSHSQEAALTAGLRSVPNGESESKSQSHLAPQEGQVDTKDGILDGTQHHDPDQLPKSLGCASRTSPALRRQDGLRNPTSSSWSPAGGPKQLSQAVPIQLLPTNSLQQNGDCPFCQAGMGNQLSTGTSTCQCCCEPYERSGASDPRSKANTRPTPPNGGHRATLGALEKSRTSAASFDPSRDLEKGLSTSEHVQLSVHGMMCISDQQMLVAHLESLPGVENVAVSLPLSQAALNLDTAALSVEEVIRQLHCNTQLSCTVIESQRHILDVELPGTWSSWVSQEMPPGIIEISPIDGRIARIIYDASQLGPRDILQSRFGQGLQLAPIRSDPSARSGTRQTRKMGYMTVVSAIMTIPVLVLAWAPLPPHAMTYGAVSLALATLIQVFVAGHFYSNALRTLVCFHAIEVDFLVVLSTSTAYIFSVVSYALALEGRPLPTGQFFETSTLVVTLIMFARYISAFSRQKAVESISLQSLQPSTAILVGTEGTQDRELDARLLQYGDIFRVPPESRIATDGTVVSGETEVDESLITGESQPVYKGPKSAVVAGSVNSNGTILVRVSNLAGDNSISKIANMVEEAKASKPRTQEIADRVAGYFVPTMIALTVITFISWTAVSLNVRHRTASDSVIEAITYSIAVLIISCPCAIGLAVPMVIIIGGGVAAKRGVIFKSGKSMEIARKVSHVVFDKTGTLTLGQLSVCDQRYFEGSPEKTKSILLGLISSIKHPVSAAVTKHLVAEGVSPAGVDDVKTVFGSGIEGKIQDTFVRAGNSRWLGLESRPESQRLLNQGLTAFCVVIGTELVATFGLRDSLRPEAASTIQSLTRRGITVSIVSGDDAGPVQGVATQFGVPLSQVRSRCSPADKQQYIEALADKPLPRTELKRSKSGRSPVILFCGDGTNDAVALAQANIGVHMTPAQRSAGDLAQTAADVVLLHPFLTGILDILDLSRAVWWRIALNFAWSFVYNLVAVLLASGAFAGTARIPPRFAALGELVSVMPVILIALQLKWARFGRRERP